jgi:hypothetical protein
VGYSHLVKNRAHLELEGDSLSSALPAKLCVALLQARHSNFAVAVRAKTDQSQSAAKRRQKVGPLSVVGQIVLRLVAR